MSENPQSIATFEIRHDAPVTATAVQEHIMTTPDRVKVCIREFRDSLEHQIKSQVFGGISLTLVLCIASTKEFQPIGFVPKEIVQAVIWVGLAVSLIYFVVNLWNLIRTKGGMAPEVFAQKISVAKTDPPNPDK